MIVKITKRIEVDTDAFVALAGELLEALDDEGALLVGRVSQGLIPDSNPDWTWTDLARAWAERRQDAA